MSEENILSLHITAEEKLAGCHFTRGEKIIEWKELDKDEKIRVINSLYEFYKLFYKCYDGEQ